MMIFLLNFKILKLKYKKYIFINKVVNESLNEFIDKEIFIPRMDWIYRNIIYKLIINK